MHFPNLSGSWSPRER